MKIASIMTGTSVDGVDICLYDDIKKKVLDYSEFSFKPEEKQKIEQFLFPKVKTTADLSAFSFWFTDLISKYYNEWDKAEQAEMVVFHGQTIFHDPEKYFSWFPSTLQLGNGSALAQLIKKDVLWDVRSADIALGGQGAPLVVYGDRELFFNGENMAIINIGGISNVTYLGKDGHDESFDLGPGNALIDAFVKEKYNIPFDKDGLLGAKGTANEELLSILMEDEFVQKQPPKTTGKERFNIGYIKKILEPFGDLGNEDIIATLTKFVAKLIYDQVDSRFDVDNFVIAGGGANNDLLMKEINSFKKGSVALNLNGVDHNARETVSFAVLGSYYSRDLPIGIITGSKKKYIAGSLAKYRKFGE